MIFSLENLLILLSLLTLNIILINFSIRKRRYGIYSSIIFQVLFFSYWIYLLAMYKFSDHRSMVLAPVKVSYNKKDKTTINNEAYMQAQARLIQAKIEKEESLSVHIQYLNMLLRAAEIQALLTVLLGIFGLLNTDGRAKYYYTVIGLHVLFFSFCLFADISDAIDGILN